MFLGKLMAWAAMREGSHVSFLPAYGAEVRGGTSHCSLIISGREIFSPCVERIDTLVAMNSPSISKFMPLLAAGAQVFINSSMVEEIPRIKKASLYKIPFTDLAVKLGSVRSANMIALGAYLSKKKTVSINTIIAILPEAFKNNQELIRINEKALRTGAGTVLEKAVKVFSSGTVPDIYD